MAEDTDATTDVPHHWFEEAHDSREIMDAIENEISDFKAFEEYSVSDYRSALKSIADLINGKIKPPTFNHGQFIDYIYTLIQGHGAENDWSLFALRKRMENIGWIEINTLWKAHKELNK